MEGRVFFVPSPARGRGDLGRLRRVSLALKATPLRASDNN